MLDAMCWLPVNVPCIAVYLCVSKMSQKHSGMEIQKIKKNRCGLEGPGIATQWGRGFPYQSRLASKATQPPIQWAPGFFSGGKAAGAGR
jgi:hypothetical protein